MTSDRHGGCEPAKAESNVTSVDDAPDPDEFYRLLSSSVRRRVLYFLQEHREASVEELSDVLVGWKAVDAGSAVAGRSERNQIRITLHHVHLPMLEKAGVLTYDDAAREASLEALPGELAAILRRARAYDAETSET